MTRMNDEVQQALARGVDWLVAQQLADGGWHSATYGQLKDGAAVTALALNALAHAAGEARRRHAPAIDRGFAFLARGIAKRGTLASPDGSLDFPTYTSALWLMAARLFGRDTELAQPRQQIVEYLLAAQI